MLHSILARTCDLGNGIALALSVSDRSDSQTKAFSLVSGRLETTVIRPLRGSLAEMGATQESEMNVRTASASRPDDAQPVLSITALGDELWTLAKNATALQVHAKMPAQTKEAAAGLQYLACELVTISDGANGKSSTAARLSELKAIQAELPTGIQAESNGPYLVTNGERLFNWLGERIPLCPLTRCAGVDSRQQSLSATGRTPNPTSPVKKIRSVSPIDATTMLASKRLSSTTEARGRTPVSVPTDSQRFSDWAKTRL
jgi:hypothetical protein